jgi:hypothetical protein
MEFHGEVGVDLGINLLGGEMMMGRTGEIIS